MSNKCLSKWQTLNTGRSAPLSVADDDKDEDDDDDDVFGLRCLRHSSSIWRRLLLDAVGLLASEASADVDCDDPEPEPGGALCQRVARGRISPLALPALRSSFVVALVFFIACCCCLTL